MKTFIPGSREVGTNVLGEEAVTVERALEPRGERNPELRQEARPVTSSKW